MPTRRRVQSSMWRAPRTRPAQLCIKTTAGKGPLLSGRTTRMVTDDAAPSDGAARRTDSPALQPTRRSATTTQTLGRMDAYRLARMTTKPAVSLVAVAGRRQATLDLAQRLEHEGFTGI